MELNIRINLDNAAFETLHNVAQCLTRVSEEIAEGPRIANSSGFIRDSNGNTVGEWHIIE